MATATKLRWRMRLPTGKVVRPGIWLGNPTTNAAVPAASLQAVVDAARAELVATGLMAGYTTGITFEEMEAQNFVRVATGDPPPAPAWEWEAETTTFESAGADVAGTIVDDTLPPNVAWVWGLKSATPGPKGRNRYYGPPLAEGEVDSTGTITGARRTQLGEDMTNILVAATAAAPAGNVGVIASAIHDELYPIVVATVGVFIATQRRRLDRSP